MLKNDMTTLWEILEQMPTEKLDSILQEELCSEPVNGVKVQLILEALRSREGDCAVDKDPATGQAWERYRENIPQAEPQKKRSGGWILKTAVAAVLALSVLVVLPQDVEAMSFWERLARWTESIFSFSESDIGENEAEYKFRTDNAGLQQVYDAVAGLGVTEPVVPMWLPEGYELVELKTITGLDHTSVYSAFKCGENEAAFSVDVYHGTVFYQYPKDETEIIKFEINGTKHYIMKNSDKWAVAWTNNHIECLLSIDCNEDTLYEILKSIYATEDE